MLNVSAAPDKAGTQEYNDALRKAAAEFEAVLLTKMFQAMRESVPESELLGGGFEQGVYQDMLFAQLSSVSASAESLGVADMVFRSFVGDDS